MDPIKISKNFQMTEDDFMEFSKIATKKLCIRNCILNLAATITFFLLLFQMISIGTEFSRLKMFEHFPEIHNYFYIGMAVLFAVFFVSTIFSYFNKYSKFSFVIPEGSFLRSKTTTIDESGISEETDISASHMKWAGILTIQNSKKTIHFYVDKMSAYVIPKHGFEKPEDAEAFYKQAVAFWEAAKNPVHSKNPWARQAIEVSSAVAEEAR